MSSTSYGLHPDRLSRIDRWLEEQVQSNRVAGASVLVSRGAEEAYFKAVGQACVGDVHSHATDFNRQTLVRLYSMTKPVATVAAMMLYEQGCFQLDDPVARFLPAFAETPVWNGEQPGGDDPDALMAHLEPQQSPMTIRQLMTHTAGLTYSFMNSSPVDRYYRHHDLVFPGSPEPLSVLVERLAKAPLLAQPGAQWNYSVATDVLGRLVEIWSGQTFDQFLLQHIFTPLGMKDTGFHVEPHNHARLADLMGPEAGGGLGGVASETKSDEVSQIAEGQPGLQPPIVLEPAHASTFKQAPTLYSGGGGLVGSIDDYARFCQMLLNAGELDGQRLLSRKTVEYMRQNQLPDNGDMASMGQAVWSETSYKGIGFGLGFAVVMDPVEAQMMSSVGEHHWGGAASTTFWIDPLENLYTIFLTQLLPSSSYPIRRELRTAVYQALV